MIVFYIYVNVKVGLLNVEGYYNSLLSFIDNAVEEGFISPTARHIIVSAPSAKDLVMKLEVIYIFFIQFTIFFQLEIVLKFPFGLKF